MWRRILLVLAATLAAPASAHACTALPAGFAEDARVTGSSRAGLPTDLTRTSLCVRAAGRRIVLRRARLTQPSRGRPAGAIVGGAAAAGRRVIWIETRFPRGRRVVVVYVVRIGARGIVRPERRIVVRRDRSRLVPEVDVAITARGELAWLAPVRRPADWNAVVYDPPDGTPRRVGLDFAGRLAVEDRITLRWYSGEHLGFFELPRRPGGGCPARTRFRHVASNDTIRVTRRTHNETVLVVRACLLATGGDRAVAQALPGFDELLGVVGLDRHRIVVWRGHILRTGESCEITQSVIDARSGGIRRQARTYPCEGGLPLPTEGAPLAVTSRGVAAWVSDQDGVRRLLAAGPDERVVELDRGAIEGLRARGAAVEWTRDGAPRSMELP
jgi:hypothetical protein